MTNVLKVLVKQPNHPPEVRLVLNNSNSFYAFFPNGFDEFYSESGFMLMASKDKNLLDIKQHANLIISKKQLSSYGTLVFAQVHKTENGYFYKDISAKMIEKILKDIGISKKEILDFQELDKQFLEFNSKESLIKSKGSIIQWHYKYDGTYKTCYGEVLGCIPANQEMKHYIPSNIKSSQIKGKTVCNKERLLVCKVFPNSKDKIVCYHLIDSQNSTLLLEAYNPEFFLKLARHFLQSTKLNHYNIRLPDMEFEGFLMEDEKTLGLWNWDEDEIILKPLQIFQFAFSNALISGIRLKDSIYLFMAEMLSIVLNKEISNQYHQIFESVMDLDIYLGSGPSNYSEWEQCERDRWLKYCVSLLGKIDGFKKLKHQCAISLLPGYLKEKFISVFSQVSHSEEEEWSQKVHSIKAELQRFQNAKSY